MAELHGKIMDQHIAPLQDSLRSEFNATDAELSWFSNEIKKWFGDEGDPSTYKWEHVLNRTRRLFRWARETSTPLTGDMFTLLDAMDKWTIKHDIFSVLNGNDRLAMTLGEPEASGAFAPADLATPKGVSMLKWLDQLDRLMTDGITAKEIAWFASKYLGNAVLPELAEARLFLEEVRLKSQNIVGITYDQGRDIIRKKQNYIKRLELARDLPKQDIVKRFHDGWTVVRVKDGPEREAEESITDFRSDRDTSVLFSVHDHNNVPMAIIEVDVMHGDPRYFGVVEASESLGASDSHFKAFMTDLKSTGVNPVWIEDDSYHPTLKDVEEAINDPLGIAPYVSGFGGSVDAYEEAFEKAYSDSWASSYYYRSQAKGWIDTLGSYALDRGEEKMFDAAIDKFSDYANDLWSQSDYDMLKTYDIVRPEEEDEEFQDKNGKFQQKKFDKAMVVFYEKEQEVMDNFEAFEFLSDLTDESKNLKRMRAKQKRGIGKKKKEVDFQTALMEGLTEDTSESRDETIEEWLAQEA